MKEMKTGTKVLIGVAGSYIGIIIYCIMGMQLAKTSIPAIPRGLIAEVFLTVVAVALVIILKRKNIYKNSAVELKTGFKCGIPIICELGYIALGYFGGKVLLGESLFEGIAANTIIINLILSLILSVLVGIAEETLFRGIIYNELRDLWGRNSLKGVYLAVIVSSILFGGTHLTNLIKGADSVGVLMQIINATITGLAYCAIYYRSNSLWVPIIFHGLNDFIGYIQSGMLSGMASTSDVVSTYQFKPTALVFPILELTVALVLLRKKKVEQLLDRE